MAKQSDKEDDSSPRLEPASERTGLWALLLVLAVILVYQPIWYAGFIWDDDLLVTANPDMASVAGLKDIWTTSGADLCPLALSTFWIVHAVWDIDPLPYHLLNVLLHAASAVVLWRVLLGLRIPGAWLGAALWALHPVQVESVAWIAELKNTESALFFLLAILFFTRGLRLAAASSRVPSSDGSCRRLDGGSPSSGWRLPAASWNDALTVLFAFLAMTSKPSTITLPVVLMLCAWWVEGRWNWRNLSKLIPVFLMSAMCAVLLLWAEKSAVGLEPLAPRSWLERLVTAGDAVWFYLGKLIWPFPLIPVYPRWQIDAGNWVSFLPLPGLTFVVAILWIYRETWSRPCFFTMSYFMVTLLPVLGLVDHLYMRYSFVADHFQYLASMGPLALAGAALAQLPRAFQPTVCACVLLFLGILTWQQAWVYESQESLWSYTVSQNPTCWVGYDNLGVAAAKGGRTGEAIENYQKSLGINPTHAETRLNLGKALAQTGRIPEALTELEKARDLSPQDAGTHLTLGDLLFGQGRMDEAITEFQKALAIDPTDAEANDNLGVALARKGQLDEAIVHYEAALKSNPDIASFHYNLGIALTRKGRFDEAIAQYQAALENDPENASLHNNLGQALLQVGRRDEAIAQFEQALQLNPADANAQNNLTKAQTQLQQPAASKP